MAKQPQQTTRANYRPPRDFEILLYLILLRLKRHSGVCKEWKM